MNGYKLVSEMLLQEMNPVATGALVGAGVGGAARGIYAGTTFNVRLARLKNSLKYARTEEQRDQIEQSILDMEAAGRKMWTLRHATTGAAEGGLVGAAIGGVKHLRGKQPPPLPARP